MTTYLLLHGGAGLRSVAGFADLLGDGGTHRVIAPAHPGFDGTERPDALRTIPDLARHYAALLDELDLGDVTVIGNSIGGWIAAELALLHSPRVSRVIFVDSVGIELEGHPVADFFGLTLPEVADYSFYEPDKFRIDPSAMPPAAQQAMAGNRAALALYGRTMIDPTLRGRLAAVDVTTVVIWGEADRIVDVDYGRAFAAAIPGAQFVLLEKTGHLPQLETPELLRDAIVSAT